MDKIEFQALVDQEYNRIFSQVFPEQSYCNLFGEVVDRNDPKQIAIGFYYFAEQKMRAENINMLKELQRFDMFRT